MRDKVSDLDTSEMPKRLNKYGKYETNLFSIHPDDWKNFADYVCRCLSRVVCNRFVYCFVFNGTQYKNAKLVVALKHKDSNEKYIPTLGYGHVYTATNEPASSVIEATINKYIRPLTDSERERLNAK